MISGLPGGPRQAYHQWWGSVRSGVVDRIAVRFRTQHWAGYVPGVFTKLLLGSTHWRVRGLTLVLAASSQHYCGHLIVVSCYIMKKMTKISGQHTEIGC
jgi:hypothetical protein